MTPVRPCMRRWALRTLPSERLERGRPLPAPQSTTIFRPRREIFLALLQREHESWIAELEDLIRQNARLSVEEFADRLAGTLERRECMLKLESMNLYDMEGSSRMENLVAFKRVYAAAIGAVTRCLEQFFPAMTAGDIQDFIYAFFPSCLACTPMPSPQPSRERQWSWLMWTMPGIPSMKLQGPLS